MLTSVVIPIYNAERYLQKCIDSVLRQTYADFELLLINDGSTDNSGIICDEYKRKDKRIRVFHEENRGASNARNLGLKHAKGDWISFVDSDDLLLPNYLEDLIRDCSSADFVINGITIIETGDDSKKHILPKKAYKGVSIEDSDILNTVPALCLASPISKLFKRTIIEDNNILFDARINIGEDYLFVADYISCIDSLNTGYNSHYLYFRRGDSLSTTYNTFEEESLAEELLYQKTLRVYKRLGYDDREINIHYVNEFKKHAYRTLLSLYKNKHLIYSKKERVLLVHEMSIDQKRRLQTMFKSNGFKGWAISLLFKKCFFGLSDRLFKVIIK